MSPEKDSTLATPNTATPVRTKGEVIQELVFRPVIFPFSVDGLSSLSAKHQAELFEKAKSAVAQRLHFEHLGYAWLVATPLVWYFAPQDARSAALLLMLAPAMGFLGVRVRLIRQEIKHLLASASPSVGK